MSENIVDVTDETFEAEVLKHDKPVLIDFWATWCGPCRMIKPIIDELSAKITGVRFAKMDVDDCGGTATSFGIRSIPCLVMIKDGVEVDRIVGAVSAAQLEQFVLKAIKPAEPLPPVIDRPSEVEDGIYAKEGWFAVFVKTKDDSQSCGVFKTKEDARKEWALSQKAFNNVDLKAESAPLYEVRPITITKIVRVEN